MLTRCKKNLALGDCRASWLGIESSRGHCLSLSLYLRLTVLTAGTLLPLFWMVVILGHRRQRNFERVFFFLCMALVFFFSGSLLTLNAQLYYGILPRALGIFCWTVTCVGLWLLPSLLVHLQVEYSDVRGLLSSGKLKRLWLGAAYLPALAALWGLYSALQMRSGFDFQLPGRSLGLPFLIWMPAALVLCAAGQWQFRKVAPSAEQKAFHQALALSLLIVGVFVSLLHLTNFGVVTHSSGGLVLVTEYGALVPLIWLIRDVEKFNFLQIGRQRNLIYAVFVTFLALLYLSFVGRASTWTEAFLPPEATAAVLLFLPLVFFEPLQRLMRRLLRATAQSEVDRAQRLVGPILEVARLDNLDKLRSFTEHWIGEQLQLASVKLSLWPILRDESTIDSPSGAEEIFSVQHSGREGGALSGRS